jgi:hypothetical protein
MSGNRNSRRYEPSDIEQGARTVQNGANRVGGAAGSLDRTFKRATGLLGTILSVPQQVGTVINRNENRERQTEITGERLRGRSIPQGRPGGLELTPEEREMILRGRQTPGGQGGQRNGRGGAGGESGAEAEADGAGDAGGRPARPAGGGPARPAGAAARPSAARSFNGVEVPDGLDQNGPNGVEALQLRLVAAGFELPRFGTDGDFGRESRAAFEKAAREAGIDDPQKINFADPNDRELRMFNELLAERTAARAQAAATAAGAAVAASVTAENEWTPAPAAGAAVAASVTAENEWTPAPAAGAAVAEDQGISRGIRRVATAAALSEQGSDARARGAVVREGVELNPTAAAIAQGMEERARADGRTTIAAIQNRGDAFFDKATAERPVTPNAPAAAAQTEQAADRGAPAPEAAAPARDPYVTAEALGHMPPPQTPGRQAGAVVGSSIS